MRPNMMRALTLVSLLPPPASRVTVAAAANTQQQQQQEDAAAAGSRVLVPPLAPHALRVEYLAAPLGVEVHRSPRFSWRLAPTPPPPGGAPVRNLTQAAYELQVCKVKFDRGRQHECYGVGTRVASPISVNVELPGLRAHLTEDTLYTWRVRWWADNGSPPSPFSPNASFGTELRTWSDSSYLGGNYSSNLLRTEFSLQSNVPVGRACLYIVGLGNYRAFLSGQQVGNVFRTPPTQFAERLLYDVHDVTNLLNQRAAGARHALGVALGHARYASQASATRCTGGQVTCDMATRVVLSIVFEDGETQRVVSQSDGKWQVAAGPTVHDDSYSGEVFDARLAMTGWSEPGFYASPSRWRSAKTVETPPGAVLSSYIMPPVTKAEIYTAVRTWQPQHNEHSFDFGQSVAGAIELAIPEGCPPGTRIKVTHGEAVHQPQQDNAGPGRVFHLYDCGKHGNGCTAFVIYICSGEESVLTGTTTYSPSFFTSGGRYVKIEGYPGPLAREHLRLAGVRVNVEHSGSFVTSNDRLNEVSRIGRGSFLGNLAFGFPSDCPTREKRGWLDSGHGAAPWAMMNYDVAATYTVFLRTIRDAQLFHGGATGNMPSYAPAFGNGLTQLTGILQEDTPDDLADPGWAAAYGLLVEYMYTFYADDRVWSDHYEHVARYIEFVAANATDSDGLFTYSRFGDWCAYKWIPGMRENSGMGGCYGLSPMSSAFFYAKQLDVLRRAAVRLNKSTDAYRWGTMLSNVTVKYRARFLQNDTGIFSDNADGRGTQAMMGSQALALAFPDQSLLSDAERQTVGQALVRNIEAHGYHPYAGELSVTYLFHGLAEQQRPDAVVAMASNPEQPGWGFMVEEGATTMYESWYTDRYNSIGSRFHDMFVGPFLWFFSGLGGLSQQAGSNGWKYLRIAPQAYNFWSFPNGTNDTSPPTVRVITAIWGANCMNGSGHDDLTNPMRSTCDGMVKCRFVIPNISLCDDPPPPPPPPTPPPPAPPPSCIDNCHMVPLPAPRFFTGIWNHQFTNITTENGCIDACLHSPSCVQVTWLKRPDMPCSHYSAISGGWPPDGSISGVSAFLKCFLNESTGQACNRRPAPPPPAPPSKPLRRRVFAVNYTCGSDPQHRLATLGPDKGSHIGDGAGVSFTEAAGREIHLDCAPRAAPLLFAQTETVTYQGRVASSWRVFPRLGTNANSASLCEEVDVNTYTSSLPEAIFGSDISEHAALNLSCTTGVMTDILFASFGQPFGTCGNLSINPECHSPNSSDIVAKMCRGKQTCIVPATIEQFGGIDPCPRDGTKLNNGPQRLAVAVSGCHSAKLFELNISVPVGSQADVVLPTKLLGVDPSASTTQLSEIHMGIVRPVVDDAGDLVMKVGSGSYAFVLSAA